MRDFFHNRKIFPRRWLRGIISYSRFIGYIQPELLNGNSEDYRIWRKLLRSAWQPRELSLPVGKRMLVISPHSDDEAIGAGGLLWAHRDCAEIHIMLLTDGAGFGFVEPEDASHETQSARLVRTRNEELMKTAESLKAKSVQFLEMPDGGIVVDDASVAKLRSALDSVKPDVVLLPWFLDDHPDHQAANRLFAQACNNPGMLVLSYEIWATLDPNAWFDITEHLDAKLALVNNYSSQLKEVDYVTFAQSLAWVRGYQLIKKNGRKAAEAFVALPAEDYCGLVNEVLSA